MTTDINPTDSKTFRMPIEEMYTLDVGLMVIGRTQQEGRLKEGDEIAIVGLDKTIKTRVEGIDIRGDSMGIKLKNVSQNQLEVGMIVTREDF